MPYASVVELLCRGADESQIRDFQEKIIFHNAPVSHLSSFDLRKRRSLSLTLQWPCGLCSLQKVRIITTTIVYSLCSMWTKYCNVPSRGFLWFELFFPEEYTLHDFHCFSYFYLIQKSLSKPRMKRLALSSKTLGKLTSTCIAPFYVTSTNFWIEM